MKQDCPAQRPYPSSPSGNTLSIDFLVHCTITAFSAQSKKYQRNFFGTVLLCRTWATLWSCTAVSYLLPYGSWTSLQLVQLFLVFPIIKLFLKHLLWCKSLKQPGSSSWQTNAMFPQRKCTCSMLQKWLQSGGWLIVFKLLSCSCYFNGLHSFLFQHMWKMKYCQLHGVMQGPHKCRGKRCDVEQWNHF